MMPNDDATGCVPAPTLNPPTLPPLPDFLKKEFDAEVEAAEAQAESAHESAQAAPTIIDLSKVRVQD